VVKFVYCLYASSNTFREVHNISVAGAAIFPANHCFQACITAGTDTLISFQESNLSADSFSHNSIIA
jgi:hypothetical protein